jgi:hypothetical protein
MMQALARQQGFLLLARMLAVTYRVVKHQFGMHIDGKGID